MVNGKIIVARILDKFDGREPWRAGVITRINRQKFETICVFLVKGTEEENYFSKFGYKVFYLSDKEVSSLSPNCIYRLAKILKDNHVDIVHCHRHKCTVIGTLASIFASVPVVISQVHALNRTRTLSRRLINYFLFKRVSKIITVGKAMEQDVVKSNFGLPTEKVSSEGNSIEYQRFTNSSELRDKARKQLELPKKAFVFGTVARMVPDKGQTFLIKAFESVKKVNPDAYLILVGYGKLRPELEKQAQLTGYSDSILFLGYKKDVTEVLPAMDAFVMPSLSEGIPRAVLEAISAGIPCIGTDVSGIPEIIDDGISGILVPPADANSLADAMVRVMQFSQSRRDTMIEAGKQKIIQSFNHEKIVSRLEKMYEEEFNKYHHDSKQINR